MKFNGNINYLKCLEFNLNLSEGAIMDVMLNLSTWAKGKEINGEVYYYLTAGKLIEELPIISNKENTFRKILKVLKDKQLIESIIFQNKGYYKISELGKDFYKSVENNPQECGKKSTPGVEKNPHYNNTNNNTTKDNIISKDIIKPKTKIFGSEDFEYQISKFFLSFHIEEGTPSIIHLLKNKSEYSILQGWANEIRKMKEVDKFTEDQIAYVIKFTVNDDFWKNQILSIEKFRKKNREGIPYFVVMIDKIKQGKINLVDKSKLGRL